MKRYILAVILFSTFCIAQTQSCVVKLNIDCVTLNKLLAPSKLIISMQDFGSPGDGGVTTPPVIVNLPIYLDISSNSSSSLATPRPIIDRSCCDDQIKNLEPTRGNFNFSSINNWITRFKAQGSKGLFTWGSEGGTPTWMNSAGVGSLPDDINISALCQNVLAGTTTTDCKYKELVTKFEQNNCHVTSEPTTPIIGGCDIKNFETWNEFNAQHFNTGSYQNLAQMAFDMAKIIRKYQGDAFIIGGSVSAGGDGFNPAGGSSVWNIALLDFLTRWSGITGFVPPNAISFHAYPARTNVISVPFPETLVSYNSGACTGANTPNSSCRTAIKDMAVVARAVTTNASISSWASTLPIWNTEWGYGLNTSLIGNNQAETDVLRKAWVSRSMIWLALSEIKVNLAYAYAEPNWMTFFSGGVMQPVQIAWVKTSSWLSNSSNFAVPIATIVGGEKLYTLNYTHNGSPAILAWYTGHLTTTPYTLPAGITKMETIDSVISTPGAGAIIQVTQTPIFLN